MHKILIGIPVKNTGKYLKNLLHQIDNLHYDKSFISIAIVEGDSNDDSYQLCLNSSVDTLRYRECIVHKLDLGFDLNHTTERYERSKFPNRIKNLVITRNYIVNNYLSDNDYLWWIDSDFEHIPPDTLLRFIKCNKDVVIPTLTHDTYGYHDCGSVFYEDGKQIRFQFEKSADGLIRLDRADTHCFIKREVFNKIKYEYVDKKYVDGCGGEQDCYSDGTQFSYDCVAHGFSLYGSTDIVIKHHNV